MDYGKLKLKKEINEIENIIKRYYSNMKNLENDLKKTQNKLEDTDARINKREGELKREFEQKTQQRMGRFARKIKLYPDINYMSIGDSKIRSLDRDYENYKYKIKEIKRKMSELFEKTLTSLNANFDKIIQIINL